MRIRSIFLPALRVLIVSILVIGCDKDAIDKINKDGVYVSKELVWKAETIDGERPLSIGNPKANWIHQGKAFIVGGDSSPKAKLLAFDISTGERLWEWSDIYGDPKLTAIETNHFVTHNNSLLYVKGSRHYSINMNDGSTIWRDTVGNSFSPNDLESYGDQWYGSVSIYDGTSSIQYLARCSFDEPGFDTIVKPPFHFSSQKRSRYADITSYELLPDSNGEQMAIVYQNMQAIDGKSLFQTFLGLYDFTENAWIYNGVPINTLESGGVALYPAKLVGDKIYCAAGSTLGCYDVNTGTELWKRVLPGEIWSSGFTISDGVCAVNCEDYNMYGLDENTGVTKWTFRTAQHCTPLDGRVINGVVYFVGGSDKSLFAVDLREGKIIWKLDAERMVDDVSYFKRMLYVQQPTASQPGKIITQAGSIAMCIEAHR